MLAVVVAAVVHLGVGWFDEHRFVLVPHGHLTIVVLAAWLIALGAGLSAVARTRGRSWAGWLACVLGLVGTGVLLAPSRMI